MPDRERVQEFIALVQGGETVRALREYYTEDAIQQENTSPPREGRDALIEHEIQMLAAFEELEFRVSSCLIDGDQVAINYVFSGRTGGRYIRQDELALQRWDGDRIAAERFYYDPGQTRPAARKRDRTAP